MNFVEHIQMKCNDVGFDIRLAIKDNIIYVFPKDQIMQQIKSKIAALILESRCDIFYENSDNHDSISFIVNETQYHIHFYQYQMRHHILDQLNYFILY